MAALHPRPPFAELTYDPTARWIRGTREGNTVVDTRRAVLLWEPGKIVPIYAFPAEDVALAGAGDAVTAGLRRFGDPDLAGYVTLPWDALEHWYEENEEVFVHPRDPFVRVNGSPHGSREFRESLSPGREGVDAPECRGLRVPVRVRCVASAHIGLRLRVAGALRPVLRLPLSAARRLREQVEKEDRARLIATFAALDGGRSHASHQLMWRSPMRHPSGIVAEDPLEQLWKLPARQPHTPN